MRTRVGHFANAQSRPTNGEDSPGELFGATFAGSVLMFIYPAVVFTLLALCSCASIPPGHKIVEITPNGRTEVLGEGMTLISPFATVEDVDLRRQERNKEFTAITADGLPIKASDAMVTFHIVQKEIVAFAKQNGSDYEKTLLDPIVQSTVRRILAAYRWDQMDTEHLDEAQRQITSVAAEQLREFHVVLDSVELKKVIPQLHLLNDAITQTEVWKQKALQQTSEEHIAVRKAEVSGRKGEGLRVSNMLLRKTLTPSTLANLRVKAWDALFASSSADVTLVPNNTFSIVEVAP